MGSLPLEHSLPMQPGQITCSMTVESLPLEATISIVVLLVSLPESEKGDQMPARILFLCARGSGRALLAASLLQSMAGNRFEIWSTPTQDTQEHALIGHILQEQRVALLPPDRLTQPAFGLRWDEGIILCSGLTDT